MHINKFIQSLYTNSTHGDALRQEQYDIVNKPGVNSFKIVGIDFPTGTNTVLDHAIINLEGGSYLKIHLAKYHPDTGVYNSELFAGHDFIPHIVDFIEHDNFHYLITEHHAELVTAKYMPEVDNLIRIVTDITTAKIEDDVLEELLPTIKMDLLQRLIELNIVDKYEAYVRDLTIYDLCFNLDNQETLVSFDLSPELATFEHISVGLKRKYDIYLKGDYKIVNPHPEYTGDIELNTDLGKMLFADIRLNGMPGMIIDGREA